MTDPDRRGSCGCGWHGPWRTADSDVRRHCDETGCEDGAAAPPPPDDLMPHERFAHLRKGGW